MASEGNPSPTLPHVAFAPTDVKILDVGRRVDWRPGRILVDRTHLGTIGHVEMRELLATDGPAVHTLLGDPEVAAWFRSSGPFTLEECEAMVSKKVAHRVAHGFGWYLAWEDDDCLGWSLAQYCIVDGLSEVEIGWTVASSHWRQGIGTLLGERALAEVAPLGLDGVIAYAREDNPASHGVMRNLAMTYEKSFVSRGLPHVLYRKSLR
jgi:RimJ/RimL family protein N-acetyltransferase